MPQVLSKWRRPSHVFTSEPAAGGRLQDKPRIRCTGNRLKGRKKINKAKYVPVPTGVPQEEDWEREIEEFSRRTEKEKELSSETPYDAEDALKVALCEMSLYSVASAPRPHLQHYDPSEHHTPPVAWLQDLVSVETDQFADADE